MSLRTYCIFIFFAVAQLNLFCPADTFTNRTNGRVFHGYLTSQTTEDGNAVIYDSGKGLVQLKPAEWDITADRLGRRNKVIVITFEQELSLQIVVESLDEAVSRAADEGPLFIILEMNSPGGRADYIERICDRLIRTDYCQVIAFVKTGPYGGAISGAAAVALACDKIYMSPDTIIGAALIVNPAYTFDTEKLSVAWQEYLGTLARRGGKPELLARAMVDKDIEVIEVVDKGSRRFIEPAAAEPGQAVTRIWSRGGSLLTLTAAEAVRSDIAEAIAIDRIDILRKLDAADAEIVVDNSVSESEQTFRKVKLKFGRLRSALDGQIKRIEQTDNIAEAVNLLREIRDGYKSLLSLAKRYPDLYLDIELIEEQLDFATDYYQQAKVKKRVLTGDANLKTSAEH